MKNCGLIIRNEDRECLKQIFLSKSKKSVFCYNRPVKNEKKNTSLETVVGHKRKEGYFQIENIFNYLGISSLVLY